MTTGALLGAGGEGTVYEDALDAAMVIKVLHPQFATPDRAVKLRAMCDSRPPNWQTLGWPVEVEADANGIRYRMPRAPQSAVTVYRFISANERRRLPGICQSYEYRARVGVNIAEALRGLHSTHVRIGDVNPSNILVDDHGAVTLIDCDSFQIPGPPGQQPYPCVVGSPEYTAPEIDDFRRQFRSQDSDDFALAVLLYQLLGNGSHPYQGIDASVNDAISNIRERIKQHRFAHQPVGNRWKPTPGQMRSWRALPVPVRDAFRQSFSPVASQIGRPTSDTWVTVLTDNPSPVSASAQRTTGAQGTPAVTSPAITPPGMTPPVVRGPGAMPPAVTAPASPPPPPNLPAHQPAMQVQGVPRASPAAGPAQWGPPFRLPFSRRHRSSVVRSFFRQAARNWRISLPAAAVGLLLAMVLLETGRDSTSDTPSPPAQSPAIVAAEPTPSSSAVLPVSPTAGPTATAMPTLTPTTVPPSTPLPTVRPNPTATSLPGAALLPAAVSAVTSAPPGSTVAGENLPPAVLPALIYTVPEEGLPGLPVSVYGQALPPSVPVDSALFGSIEVLPESIPATGVEGDMYFSFTVPSVAAGEEALVLLLGGETFRTAFQVLPSPPHASEAGFNPAGTLPGITALPTRGAPGIPLSIYGRGFSPFLPVSRVTIGGLDVTPSPRPSTDQDGNLYFNLAIPGATPGTAGGQQVIEVQVGQETFTTGFHVLVTPTPPPTIAPTPAPTRVPQELRHARHSDAHYTVNVPSGWPGGRVTFFGNAYSGPPGPWVQANTIRGATRYEIMSLKDAGTNLVGTYFKERYSSEELCGAKGYVAIRETALLVHYPGSGIALHVDVCEADLHTEAEEGITNEDISNDIIRSLRNQS